MNIEKIKEELGGVIYHCTEQNFEKGYDPIGDILADLEIDNLNEDDTHYLDTAPFSRYSLINRQYTINDKDYFTLYEHLDSGARYFYSKYLNDVFRVKEDTPSLNWLISNGWYNHYFEQFCNSYIYDFQFSCNPEMLNENYFSVYEDDLLDYEKLIPEPADCVEDYYNKILNKALVDIDVIKNCKINFNRENIEIFKRWFFLEFNCTDFITENCHLKYNWSAEFTMGLMDLSLDYLQANYSLHDSGGFPANFIEKVNLLGDISTAPFESELFELIEDDFNISEDE
jgi:hypothetical protein